MIVLSEFEDKLQSILGNPEAMDQIMSIARSLGGNSPPQEESDPAQECVPPTLSSDRADPFSALSGLDPRLMQIGMRLLSEYNREDHRIVALLRALQPFLRQERCAKMDQAVQIAKLSRLIRVALDAFRKEDSDFV